MTVRTGPVSIVGRRVLLAAAALTTALAGCSITLGDPAPPEPAATAAQGDATPPPSAGGQEATPAQGGAAAVPEGFEVVESAENGVTFALPSGWEVVDQATLEGQSQRGVPGFTPETMQQLRAGVEQGLFQAWDLSSLNSSASNFATNVTVDRFPVPVSTAPELAEGLRPALGQVPEIQDLVLEVGTLPAGEAVFGTYTLPGAAGRLDVLYLAIPAGTNEAVSLALTTDQPDKYGQELFDQISGSLTLN